MRGGFVPWEINMAHLFSRQPDLVVGVPEWLAEWLDWQDELAVLEDLPALPASPVGCYLGADMSSRGTTVGALMRDLLKAMGASDVALAYRIGVSPPVVTRLVNCQQDSIRMYGKTRARVMQAFTKYPGLVARARRCFLSTRED